MRPVRSVEFYCGTKSFSKVAASFGWETFTVDINKRFKPDLIKNMWDVAPCDLPYRPDVIWASPDCNYWSCASAWKHWNRRNEPQTLYAEQAIKEIKRLLWLFDELNPVYWYIENPRGKLRKMDFMQDYIRKTVTYCQYGFSRRKPTDIWTTCGHWEPKPECDLLDSCHPGSTNDLTTSSQRAVIPPALIAEIILATELYLSRRIGLEH